MQAFKLRQASWLKYLQIRQLSHHGAEAVCALNDICVYGKSASEDLEDRLAQEAAAEGDPEADEALETAIDGEKSKHNMLLNDAGSLSLDIANGSLQSLAGSPTDSDDQQPAASGGEPLLVIRIPIPYFHIKLYLMLLWLLPCHSLKTISCVNRLRIM